MAGRSRFGSAFYSQHMIYGRSDKVRSHDALSTGPVNRLPPRFLQESGFTQVSTPGPSRRVPQVAVGISQGTAVHETVILSGIDIRCPPLAAAVLVMGVYRLAAVKGQSQHHLARG